MRIFQAMGALASSDSGASIQNKLGIAAPSLTPEELLHQQKVCWLFLIFKKNSSINKSKLPPKLFFWKTLCQVEANVSNPTEISLWESPQNFEHWETSWFKPLGGSQLCVKTHSRASSS